METDCICDFEYETNFKSFGEHYVIDLGLNRISHLTRDLWTAFDEFEDFVDNAHNRIVSEIVSRLSGHQKALLRSGQKRKTRSSLAVRHSNKYHKLSFARKSRNNVETSRDEIQGKAEESVSGSRKSTAIDSQCSSTIKKAKRKSKTRKTIVESECNETIILVEETEGKFDFDVNVETKLSETKLAVSLEKLDLTPHAKSIKTSEGVSNVIESESQTYVIEDNNLQTTETVGEVKEDCKCKDSGLELFTEFNLIDFQSNESKGSEEHVVNNQCVEDNALNKDNDWETDDENNDGNQFFDAVDDNDILKKNKRNLNDLQNSTRKEMCSKSKRKKSLYFTPSQTIGKTTRAITRAVSRIAANESNAHLSATPSRAKPHLKLSASKAITSSGQRTTRQMKHNMSSSSGGSAQRHGSSGRSTRCVSRLKTPDIRQYTESAKKRREEAEEERKKRLEAAIEKHNRVMKNRQILLEKIANERKMKAQEKLSKAAEMRELQRQRDDERVRREEERRGDLERRLKILEVAKARERREIMQKKRDEKLKKINDSERKKQLLEQQELAMKMQRQEDNRKRMEMEREAAKQAKRMSDIIQQHNSSLQQKAVIQSYLKMTEMSKNNVLDSTTDLSSSQSAQSEMTNSTNATHLNLTYVINKEEKDCSAYEMSPPPKEFDPNNYDISEIKSDDDTDDERQPNKPIPKWARGSNFLLALRQQYGKSFRSRMKESEKIHGIVKLPVDLGLMFKGQRAVCSKYARRTSSANWSSPPSRCASDSSRSDVSFK